MLVFYRFNLYFDVRIVFYIWILYHKFERIDNFDYPAFLMFLHSINLTIFKYRIAMITIYRVSKILYNQNYNFFTVCSIRSFFYFNALFFKLISKCFFSIFSAFRVLIKKNLPFIALFLFDSSKTWTGILHFSSFSMF